MKRFLLWATLSLGVPFTVISCGRDDDAPAAGFDENAPQTLATMQLPVLYKMMGAEEGVFKQKLIEHKVAFSEKSYGDWNHYFAENPASPFKRYRIEFVDTDRNVKYGNPVQRYRGTSGIRIHPVNQDGSNAAEADYKKVFDYFHSRLNKLDPAGKPHEFTLYNYDLGYYEEVPDYETFIRELGNPQKKVNGEIIWKNNPKPYISNSSAEKNSPIMILKYTKAEEKAAYSLEFQNNIPWYL